MESKRALDEIIRKSRAHLYKPIQIAEVLYYYRKGTQINPSDVETYRNISKKWRDSVSNRLVGRASTSSQKFQDNVFESNAMPPRLLTELAEFNKTNNGIVENYIYHRLKERLSMIFDALEYIKNTKPEDFELDEFLSQFTESPGLKRSVDKAYEITIYALFSTIVRALKVEVNMTIEKADKEIMEDFHRFISLVLGIPRGTTSVTTSAKLFRVGVTNAADRGLDMWANFGPAVQVKHVSLSEDLAEGVSGDISADKIVLVCRDGDAQIIRRVTSQLPFSGRIQGIIMQSDLERWYKMCLSDKYRKTLGIGLLSDIQREFNLEFPSNSEIDPFLSERKYNPKSLVGKWAITKL